jgi:hypothetical protein
MDTVDSSARSSSVTMEALLPKSAIGAIVQPITSDCSAKAQIAKTASLMTTIRALAKMAILGNSARTSNVIMVELRQKMAIGAIVLPPTLASSVKARAAPMAMSMRITRALVTMAIVDSSARTFSVTMVELRRKMATGATVPTAIVGSFANDPTA